MKKSLFCLVITSLLFIGYSTTFADTKADEQTYRENAKSINEIRSKYENVKEKQVTFPGTHPSDAISDNWSWGYGSYTDTFNIYVWRESDYVWIEIEPLSGNPFICSSSFVITLGGIQYDTVRLENVSGSSQCGDVYVASIFWFTQWSFYDNPADLYQAFTILYDGGENIYTLDIAADPDPPILDPPTPSDGGDGGGCFIATAAYGSGMAKEVVVLRDLRDNVLLQTSVGRSFVKFYYEISSPLAHYIGEHEISRTATRLLLTPVVYGAKYPKTSVLIFLSSIIAITLILRVRRSNRF